MNVLPNDVLELIYKEKHKLEMKNVEIEIKQYALAIKMIANKLINSMRNHPDDHEPEEELMVWAALKVEGMISDEEFDGRLDQITRFGHTVYNYDPEDVYIDADYWRHCRGDFSLKFVFDLYASKYLKLQNKKS